MRLKNYLKEEGEGSRGEGIADPIAATTTDKIEPFFNKIGVSMVRRKGKGKKKKFKIPDDYKNENIDNIFLDMYNILAQYELNEDIVPDSVFNNIKTVGNKVGFKVRKSDTLFDYLSAAEEEIGNIFNLVCLYIIARNATVRNELKTEIKQALSKINTRRLVAFFIQLDKFTIGIVSIVRRVLQNVFGIEISSYNSWAKDIEYVLSNMEKIRQVLMKMNPTPAEIAAHGVFLDMILRTKAEVESKKV